MNRKANTGFAVTLFAVILLIGSVMLLSDLNPSLTGASVFDPASYVPSYCFNNSQSCINLNGDTVIDGEDETVFAQILEGNITDPAITILADFNGDGQVTNALDFQKCFVPLRDYYKDIEGGQAFCNLPEAELNFEHCQQGCPDMDGNGLVEQDDYILFQTLLGNNTADTYYPGADMNADGYIGTRDKDCMTAFYGDVVTCNMPRYFQHTNGCPDLADKNGVGNDGYVNEYDRQLFEQYWEDEDLAVDFNGDGSITWIDRVIFLKYYEHNEVIDCNIYHAPWHVGGINKQNIKFEDKKSYFGGANNLSQSFVPSYTGQLTKIRLHLRNTTANLHEVVVDVYEANSTGGPNQTYLLGSTSLVPSFELNRSSWITIPFNNPPTIYEDTMYHLVVSSPDSANNSYEWYYTDTSAINVNTSNASWYGELANDSSGSAITTGDINNDGYDDVIIGARDNDEGGTSAGKIYLFYGPINTNSGINISNADASWYGQTLIGALGFSLTTGDFNGDGYGDIMASAPGTGGVFGEVFVIYGKSEKYDSNENIRDISSFTRWVGETSTSRAGMGLASGDINNDGYDDLIIGAPLYTTYTGAVYVIYGPHYGNHSLADADVKITGPQTLTSFGNSIAVGDINYDGYGDLIIGAYDYDSGGLNGRGAVYVFYGPLPYDDEISASENDAMFYGENNNDYAGYSVASGDTNNDGYDDVIIGAYGAYSGDGEVYVLLGPVEGTAGLDNADVILKASNVGVKLGSSVASGDIDNDGYDDILSSAYKAVATERGAVYAVYGPVKQNSTFSIASIAGTSWFGEADNEWIGETKQSITLGHINSDEYMDVLISAQHHNSPITDNGESYLFYSPFAINVNGSYWNQTALSGWQSDTSKEFLFQAWLSAACADLDIDGDCDTSDEDIIKEIPDNLRYSGTPGWNERYDLNGDGKIDSYDSDIYDIYASYPQTQIKKITSCESGLTTAKYFGYNRSFAQPFRADVEELYYVGVYLKLYNGSGTKEIKVEIREPGVSGPNMNTTAKATGTLSPITESTFKLYNVSFDSYASLTANGLYYIVVSSPESPLEAEYEWKICNNSPIPERRSVLILTGPNTTTFQTQTEELSFVIYEGNNDSINQTLDVNNDGSVDSTDQDLIVASHDNWSGSQWSSKVDFNAEFGLYESLKDYTLGFKAYLSKVATCSLPNWPEGRGNGRCDSAAPYYETYLTAPEDCPACNYDYFCASSEDFTYCPDCSWPAEIPHYDSFGCGTTEFFNVTEISNVSNAVIEDCDYGKIELIGTANFTGLSLDNDINFSQAYLSIISPALNALNKSANIYLYDLGYLYPWILHDGDTCSASRCTFQSYENENLKFSVPTLGTYKEWDIQTVDGNTTLDAGKYSSLSLDVYGKAHISYLDDTNDNLKYSKWDGVQWLTSTIDNSGFVNGWTSIDLDNKNQPHISYSVTGPSSGVHYANFNGLRWNTSTVSSTFDLYSDIAVDSSNYPRIIHEDGAVFDVKYSYYNGTSWTTSTVDPNGGDYTSIALGSSDNPHTAYYDFSNSRLNYAYYNSSSWQNATVDQSANVGKYNSIAIGSANKIHISYYDETNTSLKYASCSSGCNNSANWNTTTVDNDGIVGSWTSIALDSSGNPHISYYDTSNTSLKYAYKDASGWHTQTVDNSASVGEYTSIALDRYNNVYISYYDSGNGTLKLASYLSKTEYESIEAAPDISGYNGSATTNLSINTGINLQNVSNFTIENQYGKIEFIVPVNLSPVNLQRLNLTQDINISHNYISLNIERLPMLSVPAQLSIYNLDMLYPNVLRNYLDCDEDQCEFVSFNDGTLVFNVESFSSYSAEDLGKPGIPPFLVFSFSVLSFFVVMIALEITKGGKKK